VRSLWASAADHYDPPAHDYRSDPTAWAVERLHVEPWSGQRRILESVRDRRFTAVHSCVNIGKDFAAALAIAWWIDVHRPGDALAVTSAPTGHQVRAILWKYLNRFHRQGRLAGRMNQTEWHLGGEMVAFGRKPSEYNVEALEGHHARFVLVVLDEASGLPPSIWSSAESLTSNVDSKALAIGNPVRSDGEFVRVCAPGSGWNVIHIGADETPNFTGEPVAAELAAELISPGFVERARHRWGPDSALYAAKVLGRFPVDSEDGVVRASRLAACMAPSEAPPADDPSDVQLGVDVGASADGDQTVIRERRGNRAGRVWRMRTADAMAIVGRIVNCLRLSGAQRCCVDVIGVGFGIAGRLREVVAEARSTTLEADEPLEPWHDCDVVGVNVGQAARDPKRFVRLRSEIWWEIGHDLTEEGGWDLSPWTVDGVDAGVDDDTAADLLAPRYTHDSSGRVIVESKDDVKARLGRSPDDADALLLAFYRPVAAAEPIDTSLYTEGPRIG
jgi:hypothetical protein